LKNASKIVLGIVVGLVLILGFGLLYGLFHGYFDRGQFEVNQVQWSSAKQVAIVAERSDQQALSGYTYFVLIGDHVFSPSLPPSFGMNTTVAPWSSPLPIAVWIYIGRGQPN